MLNCRLRLGGAVLGLWIGARGGILCDVRLRWKGGGKAYKNGLRWLWRGRGDLRGCGSPAIDVVSVSTVSWCNGMRDCLRGVERTTKPVEPTIPVEVMVANSCRCEIKVNIMIFACENKTLEDLIVYM